MTDSDNLPISEIFASIQGEGLLTGVPSLFFRLSGCNLRCRWCDTPYASWNPDGAKQSISDLVARARASGLRHAVLTGGEPMMFPALTRLSALLAAPLESGGAGQHITIETAGTVIPPDFLSLGENGGRCDLMSISPKLSNSTPTGDPRDPTGAWAERHESRRLNPGVLQALLDAFPPPHRQLKFVFTGEQDLPEIDALLSRLRAWSPSDILLMPEGTRTPTPALMAATVKACMERGFRYCARLHLDLFGNVRGT